MPIFNQCYFQIIITTKERNAIIADDWFELLTDFIKLRTKAQKLEILAINGMADHLHILLKLNPNQSIAHYVRMIQEESKKFITTYGLSATPFEWQSDFDCFSYSIDDLEIIRQFIELQKEYHSRTQVTLEEEIEDLLAIMRSRSMEQDTSRWNVN